MWLRVPGPWQTCVSYLLMESLQQNNTLGFGFEIRLGPAQAPARQLGTMARACLADGSRNAALFSAAQQKPKNSERDAHNIFKRYWLSLRVPISYVEVPPQDDGICISVPCYKAGCGF